MEDGNLQASLSWPRIHRFALPVNYEGGLSMRIIRKLAVATAAAGLAAFCAVAAGGGVAGAATSQSAAGSAALSPSGVTIGVEQSVTGCNTGSSGLLGANVFPTCTSPTSTVLSPTSFTISVDPSFFTTIGALPGINALLSLLGQQLAENVTYTLACSVNGATVLYDGSFQATATPSTHSQTVDLQTAVGSPVPNSCQVRNLEATSLVSLSTGLRLLLGNKTFTFGVSAIANTTVPGAIWMSAGKTSAGASAAICVDDANNGNAGSKVQVYQCNSALAQDWVQSSGGMLVHNGVCIQQSGKNAILAKCSSTNKAQKWTVNGTDGIFNTIVNHSTQQCLTASSPVNFTQVTVGNCTGALNQRWTGPAAPEA